MKFRALVGLTALAATTVAHAQSPLVDQALAQGIAGERFDGYMGLAQPGSSQLRAAIGAINIRRRSLYSDLAARRGASPNEVGLTAGCQLLARIGVGQAYLLADGTWRRRAAGAPPPAPDYCR